MKVLCILFVLIYLLRPSYQLSEENKVNCYSCENVCWEADSGIAKNITIKLNDTCESDCLNVGSQAFNDTENLNAEECANSKESCFTIHGVMKYQVEEDKSIFIVKYLQRGCIKECPEQVCDLSKINECKLPMHFRTYLSQRIEKGKDNMVKSIRKQFGENKLVQMGMGGEMKCCEGSGCNSDKEPRVVHANLKEEL